MNFYAYDWHASVMAPGFLTQPNVTVVTVTYGGKHLTSAAGSAAFQVPSLEGLATTATTGYESAVYDPERWDATPEAEQNEPVAALKTFQGMASDRNYRVGFAPSPDLMHGKEKVARLISEVIQPSAPYVDFIDLQIQQHENEPHTYAAVAEAAAEVCRAANPNVEVYAQLSCSPHWGANVSTLMKCVNKTRPFVTGFWLVLDNKEGTQLSRDFTAALL